VGRRDIERSEIWLVPESAFPNDGRLFPPFEIVQNQYTQDDHLRTVMECVSISGGSSERSRSSFGGGVGVSAAETENVETTQTKPAMHAARWPQFESIVMRVDDRKQQHHGVPN
jgi:hypothetical protein